MVVIVVMAVPGLLTREAAPGPDAKHQAQKGDETEGQGLDRRGQPLDALTGAVQQPDASINHKDRGYRLRQAGKTGDDDKPRGGDRGRHGIGGDHPLAMSRPQRMQEAVQETDRQEPRHRPRFAVAQRAERAGQRVLRLPLGAQRGLGHPALKAKGRQPQRDQRQHGQGPARYPGHVSTNVSAKALPTSGSWPGSMSCSSVRSPTSRS